MEAKIRITVTTIIISRSEKPSRRVWLLVSCGLLRESLDTFSMTTPVSAEARSV